MRREAVAERDDHAQKRMLDRHTDADLKAFALQCSLAVDIDVKRFVSLARQAIAYYRGNSEQREQARKYQEIEERWYSSLERGSPDYTVYLDPYMLVEVWACWCLYSRKYIKLIDTRLKPSGTSVRSVLGRVSSVLDLGCGCGYTTAALREAFPTASVTGTQYRGSPQFVVASRMGMAHRFRVVEKASEHADVVFASEYFEHHQRPVEHLRDVLDAATPRVLMVANAFGSRSVGHFNVYADGASVLSPAAASRLFSKCLRDRGYVKRETGFWNNRPALWVKE